MKPTKLLLAVLMYVLNILSPCFAQCTQQGSDIDGEAAGDYSGRSVSMPDANTIAIGAGGNDGNGSSAGHVRIYSWDGSGWVQKGTDIDGEAAGDGSGTSVSMPDANTIAIGATGNDGNGGNAGHVRIYSWNGSSWTQKGSDIDGEAVEDLSGYSVSMPDANTVAIGAIYNDRNGTDAGHVRIYSWDGSSWTQKGSDIDGEAAGDNSGYSVSMPDANTVAIGATYNDGNGFLSGHVRIYIWNGSSWTQKGSDIDGEAAGNSSGNSVSMPDANTVAIGAYWNDGNGFSAGHVRIYSWDGSVCTQKGSDINGEAAYDQSGWTVSMPDANTIAIGAPLNDGNGSSAGHVRIYSWDGSGWVQKGTDIDGEASGDYSGWPVSMPDANTVAIGASYNNGNGNDAGHVRVYSIAPLNTLSVQLGNDTSFCQGNSLTLDAGNSGATYLWQDNSTNQTYTVTASGTYYVQLTDSNSNTASDTIVVTVNPLPTINFGNDITLCTGQDTLLDAGNGFVSYSWSTGATTQTITVNSTNTYSATITDSNGCSGEDSINVTVTPLPTASIAGSSVVCDGDSTTLTASGGTTYSWSTGDTTSSIDVLPTTNTSYFVTVSDNGCSGEDSINVTITPLPTASIAGSSVVCDGDSTTLTASGGTTYSWSTSDTIAAITIAPTTATAYSVTVSTSTCEDIASTMVTIASMPTVTISGDSTLCEGESITLIATGSNNYNWSTGDTTSSISISPSNSTSYSVTTSNSCGTNIDTLFVNVYPLPTANAGEDTTINFGDEVQLYGLGGTLYSWNPATSLTCSSCQNPIASPIYPTTYILTVTDNNSCHNTDTVTINVFINTNKYIFVPNIFSPNSNNPKNNTLYVYGTGIATMQFFIYDRWGEKVFESENGNEGWDGTFRGKPMNADVFVYYLKGTYMDGEEFKQTGNITLIR